MYNINTSNHKNNYMQCKISRNWPNNTPRACLCARSASQTLAFSDTSSQWDATNYIGTEKNGSPSSQPPQADLLGDSDCVKSQPARLHLPIRENANTAKQGHQPLDTPGP